MTNPNRIPEISYRHVSEENVAPLVLHKEQEGDDDEDESDADEDDDHHPRVQGDLRNERRWGQPPPGQVTTLSWASNEGRYTRMFVIMEKAPSKINTCLP